MAVCRVGALTLFRLETTLTEARENTRSTERRPTERRPLVLFFLHNFFISIGTVLIYVCATLLLLQNNPDLSLPLGYFLAAVGCVAVGKAYEYFEHRLALKKLVRGVMLVTVALVVLMSAGLYLLDPFVEAVVLLIGYRTIYLLSGLEFWGLSALVFDVRQSKRIFGIIGSGDLPAKAIGAILVVLIHSSYSLYILLWIASVAFLLALIIQNLTFRYTAIPDHLAARKRPPTASVAPRLIDRFFGGSLLVFSLCAGMVFISAGAFFIEYGFFINVKHKYHDEGDVMSYIGYLLALAFSAATVIKLALSSRVIDRFGLGKVLVSLPIGTAFVSLFLYGFSFLQPSEIVLLNMFSGLYIFFEILRKTTYDPVFLVMFQPLFLTQRLQAHTLAKGVYEPLGMAITGLITLLAYLGHIHFGAISFLFILGFASLGFYFLVKARGHYLRELQQALSKRFLTEQDLVFQHDAEDIVVDKLSSGLPSDVLFSVNWLADYHPARLVGKYKELLDNPSPAVRRQTLVTMQRLGVIYDPTVLFGLAERETELENRPLYGQIACGQAGTSESQALMFLNSQDLSIVQGAVMGSHQSGRFQNRTRATLQYLAVSEYEADKLALLAILAQTRDSAFGDFVAQCIASTSYVIKDKAIGVASLIPSESLAAKLFSLTQDRDYDKQSVLGLFEMGEVGLPWLEKIAEITEPQLIHFLTIGCERYRRPDTLRMLLGLVSGTRLRTRTAALRSLTRVDPLRGQIGDLSALLATEFGFVYQLLAGQAETDSQALVASLAFEIDEALRRIFYILMLQYDPKLVENAMLNIEHSSREKRANAIEILDNIIPRQEYLALHSLLETDDAAQVQAVFARTVCRGKTPEPILDYIFNAGADQFSAWTLAQAIAALPVSDDEVQLMRYQNHDNELIREAARMKIESGDSEPKNNITTMHQSTAAAIVSPIEKVMVLKRTQLFENTPENILASIVPIITEHPIGRGEVIFEKGEMGNCMYVIYSGAVAIMDGETQLAEFGADDIFGELALLDTESRSASAEVTSDALLFKIGQDDFYDLMEERTELLKSVLSILCQRIRRQNSRLRSAEKAGI